MNIKIQFVCLLLLIITSIAGKLQAQDPQFSQYYAAPLFLNPAMTGTSDCYRTGTLARTQWTGLQRAFNTAMIYADLNYPDARSGFGLMVLHDNIGTSRLSSNEFSGLYSFLVPFSDQLNLRFGIQGTYASRRVNYNQMVFEDQYAGTALTGAQTSDQIINYPAVRYFDASTGVVAYGEDTYWFGLSAHHINRPEQAFYLGESRLPIKFSVHGGYNFYLRPRTRNTDPIRLIPTFNYKSQGGFDQTDIGVYLINNHILTGLWYRGIFVKEDFGIRNNDALIAHVGLQFDQFTIGYSYDITTSKLGWTNTYGSHEISLNYTFCMDYPRRKKGPPKNARRLPCPDFQKSQMKRVWEQ